MSSHTDNFTGLTDGHSPANTSPEAVFLLSWGNTLQAQVISDCMDSKTKIIQAPIDGYTFAKQGEADNLKSVFLTVEAIEANYEGLSPIENFIALDMSEAMREYIAETSGKRTNVPLRGDSAAFAIATLDQWDTREDINADNLAVFMFNSNEHSPAMAQMIADFTGHEVHLFKTISQIPSLYGKPRTTLGTVEAIKEQTIRISPKNDPQEMRERYDIANPVIAPSYALNHGE